MEITISSKILEQQNIDLNEDLKKSSKKQKEQLNVELSSLEPLQTLSVSIGQLWRIVKEQLTELSVALSGTAKENTETKKSMIQLQKDSQIQLLKDREAQLKKQAASNNTSKIVSAVAMAFGFLAAIIMAPFNPLASAIMIGGLVASLVVPLVVDKILQAAGVNEDVRGKVKMGLEIGIGLVASIASFNPVKIIKQIGATAAMVAKEAVAAAQKLANIAKAILSASANISYATLARGAGTIATKLLAKMQGLVNKIQDFALSLNKHLQDITSKALDVTKEAAAKAFDALKLTITQLANVFNNLKTSIVSLTKTISSSASQALTNLVAKLSEGIEIASSISNIFKSNLSKLVESIKSAFIRIENSINKLASLTPAEAMSNAKNLIARAKQMIIDLSTDYSKASAVKMSRISQVASEVASTVNTGFSINSASIKKDTEATEAKQEALLATIAAIIELLDRALESIKSSLTSVAKVHKDFQNFRFKTY